MEVNPVVPPQTPDLPTKAEIQTLQHNQARSRSLDRTRLDLGLENHHRSLVQVLSNVHLKGETGQETK